MTPIFNRNNGMDLTFIFTFFLEDGIDIHLIQSYTAATVDGNVARLECCFFYKVLVFFCLVPSSKFTFFSAIHVE